MWLHGHRLAETPSLTGCRTLTACAISAPEAMIRRAGDSHARTGPRRHQRGLFIPGERGPAQAPSARATGPAGEIRKVIPTSSTCILRCRSTPATSSSGANRALRWRVSISDAGRRPCRRAMGSCPKVRRAAATRRILPFALPDSCMHLLAAGLILTYPCSRGAVASRAMYRGQATPR